MHGRVRAAVGHEDTLYLKTQTGVVMRLTSRSPPPGINLPGFEKPSKRVCDPLDPDIFWERPGGRGRLCTAPLDMPGDSFCPGRADEENGVLILGWSKMADLQST